MAQTITGISKTKVINALDTYNHTALQNSMYFVSLDLSEIPPSGCIIAIKKNGVTQLSSSAPRPTQGNVKLQLVMNLAINDIIGVTISSSSAIDTNINTIKGILNIHPGSV